MKKTYFSRLLLLAANQLGVILYLWAMTSCGDGIESENYIHFVVVFLIFADAAYISYKNVRNSPILHHFTFWLVLAGWQFLLSLFGSHGVSNILAIAMLPICLYQAIYFMQLFLFQGSGYRCQKVLLAFLLMASVLATVCCFISSQAFSLAYMGQAVFSTLAILFVIGIHRKRVFFVLKSQKRELLLSCCFVVLPFLCYVVAFRSQAGYLENLGSYFFVMLSFVSVHNIVFQNHPRQERFYTLSKRNMLLFTAIGILFLALAVNFFQISYTSLLVLGYILVFLTMVRNLLLYGQIAKEPLDIETPGYPKHFYADSLRQIKREEALKKDFSNYLHDDILQDLFSMKNLVRKADQPEVQQLLKDTLGQLSDSIRLQMQTYHPTLLKTLTLKENIRNMLDGLSEQSAATIDLDCHNNIFLVEPYNIIFYRMIKELVTNSLKHSGASEIQVAFFQEDNTIFLKVADNGGGFQRRDYQDANHHGVSSIEEQVKLLDGAMTIHSLLGEGTEITITMPMKGEDSYENFIGR